MIMQTIKTGALALAISAATLSSAHAASFVLDFDGVAVGSLANSAAPIGTSFFQAHYVNDLDIYGDEILGTEKWKIDTDNNALFPVTVESTLANDYGNAPSGNNALDARWQPVLMHFDTAKNLSGFSVTLDNSAYGNLGTDHIYFLDANKAVIGSLDMQQSVPGYVATLAGSLNGVQEVVFASGALYDNVTVSSVPLPGTLPLLMSGFGLIGLIKRRKAA